MTVENSRNHKKIFKKILNIFMPILLDPLAQFNIQQYIELTTFQIKLFQFQLMGLKERLCSFYLSGLRRTQQLNCLRGSKYIFRFSVKLKLEI